MFASYTDDPELYLKAESKKAMSEGGKIEERGKEGREGGDFYLQDFKALS